MTTEIAKNENGYWTDEACLIIYEFATGRRDSGINESFKKTVDGIERESGYPPDVVKLVEVYMDFHGVDYSTARQEVLDVTEQVSKGGLNQIPEGESLETACNIATAFLFGDDEDEHDDTFDGFDSPYEWLVMTWLSVRFKAEYPEAVPETDEDLFRQWMTSHFAGVKAPVNPELGALGLS